MTSIFDQDKIHIFIDTSTLEKFNYDLNQRNISRILSADEVVVHTTTVTLFEISQRMGSLLSQAQLFSNKVSRKSHLIEWRDPALTLTTYRKWCLHVHDGTGADLGTLVKLFTSCSAPFSKKKPEEFKDAAAAIALSHWSAENGKTMHVIAEDKDWREACANLPNLKHCTLSDIIVKLHSFQAVRSEVNGDRVEAAVEAYEGISSALRDTQPGGVGVDFEFEFDGASINANVSRYRVDGDEIAATLEFAGYIGTVITNSIGETTETTSRMSGCIDATLTKEYQIANLTVSSWHVEIGDIMPIHQDRARDDES